MSEIFNRFGTDPLKLCQDWIREAEDKEINDPEAVCLATCNKGGIPSARMVLIKDVTEKGFKFHTNAESRKGLDIAENAQAALCFYWKSLRKQIRVEGPVEPVPEEETAAYFATRRIERQIGAWASQQSRPFEKWEDMEQAVEKYTGEFSGADHIPKPPYWKGYRVVPHSIEFWIAHRDRLHTRFVYNKSEDGWTATWLCP